MSMAKPQVASSSPDPQDTVDPAAVQEVSAWVGQLVRALKTCRLYESANPTVVRIREDLASSLMSLLGQRGALQLTIGTHSLAYLGHDVQTADDNLAAVLHRDGIRALGLEPGIDAREVDALADRLLAVTGPLAGDDDLVTLLWDANLQHVTIETVPLEGEADGGGEEEADRSPKLPWPGQGSGASEPAASVPPASGGPAGAPAPAAGAGADRSRSDDWTTGTGFTEIEAAFDGLETLALVEIARFQHEYDHGRTLTESAHAIRILEDCCAGPLSDTDQAELAAFIPRVLHEAMATGDWRNASVALDLVRRCEPAWSVEGFCRELCAPLAITTRRVIASLDGQDAAGVASFLDLAGQLGPPSVEWLMHVIAESDRMHVRKPLAGKIAELSRENPELILPWLADPRWYVVRNAVQILASIGGDALASYLQSPAVHPEHRVRREVVAALGELNHDTARPILMSMLKVAEPALFATILQRLASDPHSSVMEGLLELLRDETFIRRSDVERRALFSALATRGDSVLPALEEELIGGGWFSRRPESDLTAIALCVARVGTPAARAIIERGLRSGRKALRKACTIADATRVTPHE